MSIDHYQPCPCHEEKKIKFCCGKSIVPHLDDAIEKSSSNQPQAALERINRAIEAEGPKACLLTIKGSLCLELGMVDEADQTVTEFLELNPKHPAGLQQKGVVEAERGNLDLAVRYLQASMDAIQGDAIPVSAASAFLAIGDRLLSSGNFLAGRAHIFFGCNLRENPQLTQQLIPRLMAPRDLSLFLHGPLFVPDAPEDADWAGTYENVSRAMDRGQFRLAKKIVDKIIESSGEHPVLAKAGAIAASKCQSIEDQLEAWNKVAQCPGASDDQKIEALGIAGAIERFGEPADFVEIVNYTVEVEDFGGLSEKCLSCDRLDSEPLPPNLEAYFEGPPPRHKFSVFDRPIVNSESDKSAGDLPRYCGDVWLFGKQTDRGARAELHLARDHRHDQAIDTLGELGLVVDQEAGRTMDKVAADQHLLSPNLRFADATTVEQKTKLIEDVRREQLTELMDLQRAALGGKSIREIAAGDDKLNKLRAQALMLDMQHATGGRFPIDWLDEARDEVGLARLELVELAEDTQRLDIPIAFISRLNLEKLDWMKLFSFQQVAKDRGDLESGRRISEHVLKRAEGGTAAIVTDASAADDPDSDDPDSVDLHELQLACVRLSHLFLAAIEEDPQKAIEHYKQARAKAVAAGLPVGMLLVEELNYRLDRGIVESVESLIETITLRHMREPGVSESMAQLMQQMRMAAAMQQQSGGGGAEPAASMVQGSDTGDGGASGSGLWIPD